MNALQPAAPTAQPALADCWNHIGVRGDSSCPELVKYVHCRNCPVYSAAAAARLDIALPASHLVQATRQLALRQSVVTRNTQSLVIFRIGAEWLALPTSIIREITGPRPIHSLPHRNNGVVLGLANIRGQLLVCAGLRQILKLDDAVSPDGEKHATGAHLLVTLQGELCTAYPVDEVHGVQRFSPQDQIAVPQTAIAHVKAVLSWQAKSVSLLDDQLLLFTVNRSLASATTI